MSMLHVMLVVIGTTWLVMGFILYATNFMDQ